MARVKAEVNTYASTIWSHDLQVFCVFKRQSTPSDFVLFCPQENGQVCGKYHFNCVLSVCSTPSMSKLHGMT